MEQPNKPTRREIKQYIASVSSNPNSAADERDDAKGCALDLVIEDLLADYDGGKDLQRGDTPQPASTQDQALVERMQQIADRPVSFQDRLQGMKEFYETNSFHQGRPVEPLEIPEDEDEPKD